MSPAKRFSQTDIFFDLGDTLVQIRREIIDDLCEYIATFTARKIDYETYMSVYIDEWGKRSTPHENRLINGVSTSEAEKDYWVKFMESFLISLGVSSPSINLVDLLANTYMRPESYECFDDVKPTLSRLLEIGCSLGVISNAFPSAPKILEKLELRKYFSWEIYSYETQSIKPEPGIYKYALEKAGVNPRNAIFIDDRWKFVKGAAEIGMNAFLIERFQNKHPNIETNSLVFRIKSLLELEEIIKGGPSKFFLAQENDKENLINVSQPTGLSQRTKEPAHAYV